MVEEVTGKIDSGHRPLTELALEVVATAELRGHGNDRMDQGPFFDGAAPTLPSDPKIRQ